jgi:hypothetical protein
LLGVQWWPPSVETATPPVKCRTPRLRHILGRGRSCVPLKAPQIRSRWAGSNASQ